MAVRIGPNAQWPRGKVWQRPAISIRNGVAFNALFGPQQKGAVVQELPGLLLALGCCWEVAGARGTRTGDKRRSQNRANGWPCAGLGFAACAISLNNMPMVVGKNGCNFAAKRSTRLLQWTRNPTI